LSGNNEAVSVSSPTSGDWYVLLNGYAAYSGMTLVAHFTQNTTLQLQLFTLPHAQVGQPYSQQVGQATGGAPPYYYTLQTAGGFPPLGIIMDLNGNLSGTPSVAGTYNFGVCAVDLVGAQSCKTTTLVVDNSSPLSLAGDGGTVGDALGTATGCGSSTSLSLDSLIHFVVYNDGISGTTTVTVTVDVYSPDYGSGSYMWQGPVTWNGSALTGSLPRTDNPSRPPLPLTITQNSSGQFILSATVPFTYYIYITDGSCTGPVETFNYQVNGVVLSPQ
jgi:hypothetical protein